MSHSVRRHLDVEIDAYDRAIRQFVRGYDDMLTTAASAVASVGPDYVLDLGAGTGGLSGAVLAHEAIALVELIDVDMEMLSQAKKRLGDFGDRVRFTAGSYYDPLPPCDAVCASLSLHHIPTMPEKRQLYSRVFKALRPGGVFVNADVIMESDGAERKAAFADWLAHNVANGIPEAEALKNFASWGEEDTYFPLAVELEALTEAGFHVEHTMIANPSMVLVATRPK